MKEDGNLPKWYEVVIQTYAGALQQNQKIEERNAEEKRFKLASITNLKFQITYLSAMKKELSQGGRKVKSI